MHIDEEQLLAAVRRASGEPDPTAICERKVRFATARLAEREARQGQTAYKCRCCTWWHLASGN